MITRFIYRPILLIASFAWKNKINRFLIYIEMIKYYSVELASFSWVFWDLIKPLRLPYRSRKEYFKESQLLCKGGDVWGLVLVRERGKFICKGSCLDLFPNKWMRNQLILGFCLKPFLDNGSSQKYMLKVTFLNLNWPPLGHCWWDSITKPMLINVFEILLFIWGYWEL